jgi:guanylate kinase
LQVEAGLLEKENLRDDGDFRRTVVESERLEKEYAHYFDSRIINNDFDQTFHRLLREINELETKHQWVPTSWVF